MRTGMTDSFFRVLALVRKELLAILKDPRSRFLLFGPPIIECLIFGYVASFDLNDINYAVLDRDHSGASRELLSRFDGNRAFHRVAELQRPGDAAAWIDDRRAVVVIAIDADFERQLQAGRSATVQVIADGRNSNTAATALGYVAAIIDRFNADWRHSHAQPDPPVSISSRVWYNPNLETRWNFVPSLIGTLTMLQTLMLTTMSVAREREQGTFDQLLVTPFRPSEIMIGKALPSMMIGTLQATTILLVAQLWFRIGLLLSSIATTMQQAMLYTFVIIMPFMLLSGLTTPIANMPLPVQYFTRINPLRYAIDVAQRVYLEGSSLRALWYDLWPLALIAGLTLPVASWLFRKRLS